MPFPMAHALTRVQQTRIAAALHLLKPWILLAAAVTIGTGATAQSTKAQGSCFYPGGSWCAHWSLPVGSPSAQCFTTDLTDPSPFQTGTANAIEYNTLHFVTSSDPRITVDSVVYPSPTSHGYAFLSVDTTGLTPGTCYTSSVSFSATAVTVNGCGTGCNLTSNTVPGAAVPVQVIVTAATATTLLDPVPDLLGGNATKTSAQLQALLSSGRKVQGAAADGVTELAIRIDTPSPGDQFTITLVDDQGLSGQSIIPNEDGALGMPGATSFSAGQLTVSSGSADSNGMAHAFAVYRVPLDFARQSGSGFKSGTCQGATKTDDQLGCRVVTLQVQDITASTSPTNTTITIVRPPVILIHGLWGNMSNWDNFNPLVTGARTVDQRFSVGRVNYATVVGAQITNTQPLYQNVANAAENSLGFRYNADRAYGASVSWLTGGGFKDGKNPAGVPVAAVQVDIIGHSMGGDIARTLPLLPQYSTTPTFGQGLVHKVITIDTPHLGSPLASNLLLPANACTRGILAASGNYSFTSVQLGGSTVSGAIGDLSPSSAALNAINNPLQPQPHYLPTAMIAGIYTNFASLNCTTCAANILRTSSKLGCPNDPLAQSLTQQGWPAIFGENNDAIVGISSQLNTANPGPTVGFQFAGYVHSQGTEKLSFTGPSVLDPNIVAPQTISIPNQVINLLNTPVTSTGTFQLLNP